MPQEPTPPSGRRRAIFYGWRIVLLGYLLNMFTAGASSSGFSIFVKPMGDDLGWNRSSIIAATTLGMIAAAVFGHLIGTQLDKKHGPRVITTFGMFVIGLTLIGVGQVREVWQFLALFFVAGAFGMYSYPALITPTIVSKWFVRRRGMAISFASMGLPSSGMMIAPYVNFLISRVGWRTAWSVLGLTTWALTVPWCFMFMRRRPEDIGLRPDGDPEPGSLGPDETPSDRSIRDEYPWTMRQAVRTRSFWLILTSSSLGMMAFLAVLLNLFAFLTDPSKGFSDSQAIIGFTVFSAFSLFGKLPWAFIADKIEIRYTTAFTYAVPGLAMFLLINANSFWMLILWAAIYGTGISGISPLPALVWGDYFGREFLGSIRGVTSPVAFLSQAAAPLFAAVMFDVTGGYTVSFSIFLGLFLFAAILMLFARRPPSPSLSPVPAAPVPPLPTQR